MSASVHPMPQRRTLPLQLDAHRHTQAFLIWRFAKPLDWAVTVRQIHEHTGIRKATIREICNERHWPVLADADAKRRTYDFASIYGDEKPGVRPVYMEFI
ncbi:hypothetical protein DWF04_005915 [Cereibacter sphaeroides f. sp. denitrificans]